MFNRNLIRVSQAYIALQAVIWAKTAYFFFLYGHGKSMPFSLPAFTAGALEFDFFFHNGVHFAIAFLALFFGRNMKKIEWIKLVAVVLLAVVLHNVAYWLTASHPSLMYSVQDFARDSLLLLVFVVAGYVLKKIFERIKKN